MAGNMLRLSEGLGLINQRETSEEEDGLERSKKDVFVFIFFFGFYQTLMCLYDEYGDFVIFNKTYKSQ